MGLLDGRHAREDGDDVGEVPAEAVCPFGRCGSGLCLLEDAGDVFGQLAQDAATRGLHDDDGFAMGGCNLHQSLRVELWIVPVEVVDLQLHEIHLRMGGEQLVQAFRVIVYGKAHVANLADGFLLLREIPHAVLVELGGALAAYVVQQVIVDVVGAKAPERNVQALLCRLFVGQRPGKALRGDGERLAWIARHQGLSQRHFGLALMVDERRVEVGVARFHECIDHLLELRHVDALGVVLVQKR